MRPLLLAWVLVTAGCAAPEPVDRSAFLAHFPRSILVLPPLDETLETEACAGSLAAVTRPLAERGFYVFPVALVDLMMRANGLPTPFEMHQVPLSKLEEIFDPDAVLYLRVLEWGTSYEVLNSATRVTLEGRLVDVRTGALLWSSTSRAVRNSGSGQNGIVGMLVSALVNQVVTDLDDPSRDLASHASWNLFGDPRRGLLLGPYHAQHAESLARERQAIAERQAP